MSELKRPERYVQFESIKPELREITEFYTRKTADYQYRLKQLNEYADELENEISALKENPKVEVLLDDMPKALVVVPEITQKQADTLRDYKNGSNSLLEYLRVEVKKKDYNRFARAWLDGYTVEKEQLYILKHIDLSGQYKNESFYLAHSRHAKLKHESYSKGADMSKFKQCHFTQSEIDKLNIGSYEQIEVKVEEVEK